MFMSLDCAHLFVLSRAHGGVGRRWRKSLELPSLPSALKRYMQEAREREKRGCGSSSGQLRQHLVP